MRLIDLGTSRCFETIIFFDCEFTCWKNSSRTQWRDTGHPPEVIQIGLSMDLQKNRRLSNKYSAYVKPTINPILSRYCRNLLKINQKTIDNAKKLSAVCQEISSLLKENANGRPVATCSWGYEDRLYLANDCSRIGCQDPFSGLPHLDLMRASAYLIGCRKSLSIERKEIKKEIGMKLQKKSHDALADALDLRDMHHVLMKMLSNLSKKPRR
jgi:3'-5' exoribonuclease 1